MRSALNLLRYRPMLRYLSALWPLPLFLLAVQIVMWLNGNSEFVGLPYWISDLDMLIFILCFCVVGIWIYWPLAMLGTARAGQVPRLAAHLMAQLPLRAVKAFFVGGVLYGIYLLLLVLIHASEEGRSLSAPMLTALLCSVGYCSLVLVPAMGVAITLHHIVRRHLGMARLASEEQMPRWDPLHAFSDSAKRPWMVFVVTGLLPTSLLVLFSYLASLEATVAGQRFIAGQGLLLFIAGLLASICLLVLMTRSLRMVTNELATGLEYLRKGRFEGRINVLMDDDLGALANGLNMALAGLQEREVLKGSLSVASEIQQGLLPELPLDVPGYTFAAVQESCHAVGGDYYDVIDLQDGSFWLVMADVAGKGYPAALTVANLQAMLQVLAAQNVELDAAMVYINHSLCQTMTGGRFVTLFMARLQPADHSLLWVNAGHVPPLVQTADGIAPLKASTPPLGVLPELSFDVQRIGLAPGDRMLAYTDGLTETRDSLSGGMFGDKRLIDWLRDRPELPLVELPGCLLKHLHAFSGQGGGAGSLDDDVTFLCVQRERV